ncbi:MAG: putative beta-barrel porin 2 [Verrucomicrobiota bacterium]|jgi:opacity protein-like surface antigen
MSRFLIAASALTVSTLVQGANWVPTSPLVQIGNDCDLFFDASTYVEVTDNLYSGAVKKSATSWLLTPGLALEYGKDSALTVEFKASRSFVNFAGAEFAGLEDDRDALSLGVTYADGGPLKLSLNSSYRVTARNDDLQMQGVSGSVIGATLVRQANYVHNLRADYKLTERLSVGLGYVRSFNQYLDPVIVVNAGSNYNTNPLTELNTQSMPLSFDYQAFEKLSFGLVLQHDVTDYSAAPYYSTTTPTRPALDHQRLEKDFAGLTAKGQLTESGKLNGVIRAGFNRFNYDNTETQSDPSYSISLSHVLTERLSHSLTLGRDVSASTTNGRMDSLTYNYGVSFAAAEDLDFNLSVSKSDVEVAANSLLTTIDTWTYVLGASYKYNSHLSFQANYNFTDATSSNASSTFDSNTFSVSAAFRY